MPDELKRGVTLGFCEGLLHIQLSGYGPNNGDGRISFKDDDLDYSEGEDSAFHWRFMKLPKSELEAIRDFLNEWLGPSP